MDRSTIQLSSDDLNLVLVVVTGSVFFLAIVLLVFLYCRVSCCKSRRQKTRRLSNIPHVLITQHRDQTPVSLDSPDIDFIDSKTTNLVSSTVQIDSVHQKNFNM